MRLTILIDNHAEKGNISEHGFSLWIEVGNLRILFDTGQSGAFAANADRLGVDLALADSVVLSHGHYDHSGGIEEAFRRAPGASLYCHPDVTKSRFSVRKGDAKPIGMPAASLAVLEHLPASQVHWVEEAIWLGEEVGITGPIPRIAEFEDTGGPFFLDPEVGRADPIIDDQAVWIPTPLGLVVCTGCAHSGIVNTLNYVRRLNPDEAIRAVIGGFHLSHASDHRLARTIEAIDRLEPAWIIPCHCTGDHVTDLLAAELGPMVLRSAAGMSLEL